MKKLWDKMWCIIEKIMKDHVGAYATQSAFFMMLSLVPIIMLLMALVQYTPVTQGTIISIIHEILPTTIQGAIISIVNEAYKQTGTTISVSILVAFWSAGRGMLAMANGLNSIRGYQETRNYFFLRFRAAAYTLAFLVSMILTLVLLGFGNSISLLVNQYIPVLQYVTDFIIEIRIVVVMILLIVMMLFIYRFLPSKSGKFINQLPGAVFTSVGWAAASFFISMYMDIFKGFSNLYGSLTTIVLIMLWLYFCMYVMLIGAEINHLLELRLDKTKVNE